MRTTKKKRNKKDKISKSLGAQRVIDLGGTPNWPLEIMAKYLAINSPRL